MSTRLIGGTVMGSNGSLLSSVPIDIEMVLAEAFVVVGSYSVAGKIRLQTDAQGQWSTPLQCNDELTPVGTLYQVTEKVPAQYGGAKVYLIQVLSGLPTSPAVSQVLNLVVPAPVPVGGSYAPVGSGPQGIQGPIGNPGYTVVADNAALLALTKVEGLPIWVSSLDTAWVWNGTYYELYNIPRFITQGAADAAFNAVGQHKGQPYYLQTNAPTEGPLWRNSNNTYTRPWNQAWGLAGIINGSVAGIPVTGTATTVLSLNSVALTRRRQYVLQICFRAISVNNNASMRFSLVGAIPPNPLTNTTCVVDHYVSLVNGILGMASIQVPFTVTVDGNYSFQVQAAASAPANAGSVWTDTGGVVMVDDIGPAGVPA